MDAARDPERPPQCVSMEVIDSLRWIAIPDPERCTEVVCSVADAGSIVASNSPASGCHATCSDRCCSGNIKQGSSVVNSLVKDRSLDPNGAIKFAASGVYSLSATVYEDSRSAADVINGDTLDVVASTLIQDGSNNSVEPVDPVRRQVNDAALITADPEGVSDSNVSPHRLHSLIAEQLPSATFIESSTCLIDGPDIEPAKRDLDLTAQRACFAGIEPTVCTDQVGKGVGHRSVCKAECHPGGDIPAEGFQHKQPDRILLENRDQIWNASDQVCNHVTGLSGFHQCGHEAGVCGKNSVLDIVPDQSVHKHVIFNNDICEDPDTFSITATIQPRPASARKSFEYSAAYTSHHFGDPDTAPDVCLSKPEHHIVILQPTLSWIETTHDISGTDSPSGSRIETVSDGGGGQNITSLTCPSDLEQNSDRSESSPNDVRSGSGVLRRRISKHFQLLLASQLGYKNFYDLMMDQLEFSSDSLSELEWDCCDDDEEEDVFYLEICGSRCVILDKQGQRLELGGKILQSGGCPIRGNGSSAAAPAAMAQVPELHDVTSAHGNCDSGDRTETRDRGSLGIQTSDQNLCLVFNSLTGEGMADGKTWSGCRPCSGQTRPGLNGDRAAISGSIRGSRENDDIGEPPEGGATRPLADVQPTVTGRLRLEDELAYRHIERQLDRRAPARCSLECQAADQLNGGTTVRRRSPTPAPSAGCSSREQSELKSGRRYSVSDGADLSNVGKSTGGSESIEQEEEEEGRTRRQTCLNGSRDSDERPLTTMGGQSSAPEVADPDQDEDGVVAASADAGELAGSDVDMHDSAVAGEDHNLDTGQRSADLFAPDSDSDIEYLLASDEPPVSDDEFNMLLPENESLEPDHVAEAKKDQPRTSEQKGDDSSSGEDVSSRTAGGIDSDGIMAVSSSTGSRPTAEESMTSVRSDQQPDATERCSKPEAELVTTETLIPGESGSASLPTDRGLLADGCEPDESRPATKSGSASTSGQEVGRTGCDLNIRQVGGAESCRQLPEDAANKSVNRHHHNLTHSVGFLEAHQVANGERGRTGQPEDKQSSARTANSENLDKPSKSDKITENSTKVQADRSTAIGNNRDSRDKQNDPPPSGGVKCSTEEDSQAIGSGSDSDYDDIDNIDDLLGDEISDVRDVDIDNLYRIALGQPNPEDMSSVSGRQHYMEPRPEGVRKDPCNKPANGVAPASGSDVDFSPDTEGSTVSAAHNKDCGNMYVSGYKVRDSLLNENDNRNTNPQDLNTSADKIVAHNSGSEPETGSVKVKEGDSGRNGIAGCNGATSGIIPACVVTVSVEHHSAEEVIDDIPPLFTCDVVDSTSLEEDGNSDAYLRKAHDADDICDQNVEGRDSDVHLESRHAADDVGTAERQTEGSLEPSGERTSDVGTNQMNVIVSDVDNKNVNRIRIYVTDPDENDKDVTEIETADENDETKHVDDRAAAVSDGCTNPEEAVGSSDCECNEDFSADSRSGDDGEETNESVTIVMSSATDDSASVADSCDEVSVAASIVLDSEVTHIDEAEVEVTLYTDGAVDSVTEAGDDVDLSMVRVRSEEDDMDPYGSEFAESDDDECPVSDTSDRLRHSTADSDPEHPIARCTSPQHLQRHPAATAEYDQSGMSTQLPEAVMDIGCQAEFSDDSDYPYYYCSTTSSSDVCTSSDPGSSGSTPERELAPGPVTGTPAGGVGRDQSGATPRIGGSSGGGSSEREGRQTVAGRPGLSDSQNLPDRQTPVSLSCLGSQAGVSRATTEIGSLDELNEASAHLAEQGNTDLGKNSLLITEWLSANTEQQSMPGSSLRIRQPGAVMATGSDTELVSDETGVQVDVLTTGQDIRHSVKGDSTGVIPAVHNPEQAESARDVLDPEGMINVSLPEAHLVDLASGCVPASRGADRMANPDQTEPCAPAVSLASVRSVTFRPAGLLRQESDLNSQTYPDRLQVVDCLHTSNGAAFEGRRSLSDPIHLNDCLTDSAEISYNPLGHFSDPVGYCAAEYCSSSSLSGNHSAIESVPDRNCDLDYSSGALMGQDESKGNPPSGGDPSVAPDPVIGTPIQSGRAKHATGSSRKDTGETKIQGASQSVAFRSASPGSGGDEAGVNLAPSRPTPGKRPSGDKKAMDQPSDSFQRDDGATGNQTNTPNLHLDASPSKDLASSSTESFDAGNKPPDVGRQPSLERCDPDRKAGVSIQEADESAVPCPATSQFEATKCNEMDEKTSAGPEVRHDIDPDRQQASLAAHPENEPNGCEPDNKDNVDPELVEPENMKRSNLSSDAAHLVEGMTVTATEGQTPDGVFSSRAASIVDELPPDVGSNVDRAEVDESESGVTHPDDVDLSACETPANSSVLPPVGGQLIANRVSHLSDPDGVGDIDGVLSHEVLQRASRDGGGECIYLMDNKAVSSVARIVPDGALWSPDSGIDELTESDVMFSDVETSKEGLASPDDPEQAMLSSAMTDTSESVGENARSDDVLLDEVGQPVDLPRPDQTLIHPGAVEASGSADAVAVAGSEEPATDPEPALSADQSRVAKQSDSEGDRGRIEPIASDVSPIETGPADGQPAQTPNPEVKSIDIEEKENWIDSSNHLAVNGPNCEELVGVDSQKDSTFDIEQAGKAVQLEAYGAPEDDVVTVEPQSTKTVEPGTVQPHSSESSNLELDTVPPQSAETPTAETGAVQLESVESLEQEADIVQHQLTETSQSEDSVQQSQSTECVEPEAATVQSDSTETTDPVVDETQLKSDNTIEVSTSQPQGEAGLETESDNKVPSEDPEKEKPQPSVAQSQSPVETDFRAEEVQPQSPGAVEAELDTVPSESAGGGDRLGSESDPELSRTKPDSMPQGDPEPVTSEQRSNEGLDSELARRSRMTDHKTPQKNRKRLAGFKKPPKAANNQEFDVVILTPPTSKNKTQPEETPSDPSVNNEEFQPGKESMFSDPSDLDMLEKFGNKNNNTEESALARQSLFVRFDPLVEGQKLDKNSNPKDPKQTVTEQIEADDNLMLMSTPKEQASDLKGQHGLRTVTKEKAKNTLQDVDRILSFDQPDMDGVESSKEQTTNCSTNQKASFPESAEPTMIHMYSQKDFEKMKKEMEFEFQAKLLSKERDWQKERDNYENRMQMLSDKVGQTEALMKEYVTTLDALIASTEKKETSFQKKVEELRQSNADLIMERDQALKDLDNMDSAFSDLLHRYEALKSSMDQLRKNELHLEKCLEEQKQNLEKQEQKYHKLKKQAEEKLDEVSLEFKQLNNSHQTEILRLKAALKRAEVTVSSLEQQIEQKAKENQELTSICDELLEGK